MKIEGDKEAIDGILGRNKKSSKQQIPIITLAWKSKGKEFSAATKCNVLAFYKFDKERLITKVVIAFEGEDGVDAGSLSADFYQLTLDQVKTRLFLGKPERVLPITDLTKAHLFFYRWSDRCSFSIPKWPQLPLPLSSIVLIFGLEGWRHAQTCLQWCNTRNCWYRSCGRSYKTARWLQNIDRSVKLSEGAFALEIRI